MGKPKLILYFSLLLLVSAACKNSKTDSQQAETATATIQKPNVVFILADDLGIHDLNITGSTYYETPNIDRIAQEGTRFTQGYAASRVCSPSRASIMTGNFTARHGITDWIGASTGTNWRKNRRNDKVLPAEYVHSLAKEDTTLAEALKEAGYTTFFAGKWHLGSKGSWPKDHGFDINKGGWDSGNPKEGYFSPWKNPNLSNQEKGENLSMRLAKETNTFIEKHKDKPFMAYLSFYAVHGPIQTTEKKWKKYRDKAEKQGISEKGFTMERVLPIRTVQDNPVYAGLVEQMDDAVGLVLQKLEELGLDDNTMVIFTSDNGGVASGDAFSTSNLPLRGGKGYQWEGGIREPFFIKVPWLEGTARTVDEPVTGSDFYPTILDLAGIPLKPKQHIDGVSLKPLLENKKIESRSLFWHYPHYGNQGGEPSSIIRRKNWKLIHYYEDGREELYNLANDPGEQNNVSATNTEIVGEMRKELDSFLKEVDAKVPELDEDFDQELAKKLYDRKVNQLMPKLEAERMRMLSVDFKPNETWWDSKVTID